MRGARIGGGPRRRPEDPCEQDAFGVNGPETRVNTATGFFEGFNNVAAEGSAISRQ